MKNKLLTLATVAAISVCGLASKLRLDNGQQVKLHGILSDTGGQLKDLRREYGPQFALIVSNANEQITAILATEQQSRHELLKQKDHPFL